MKNKKIRRTLGFTLGRTVLRLLPLLYMPLAAFGQADEAIPARDEPLLLSAFLRQVLQNYPKLVGMEAERRQAAAKNLEKQGAFDTNLFVSTDYLAYNSSGKRKTATYNDIGVEVLTPYGFKLFAGGRLNYGAVKSPESNTGTFGEYFVGIKLPLLRGAGINEKTTALRQTELGIPLADTNFDLARLEILTKATADYWDWAAAAQRLEVAENLLTLAKIRGEAVRLRAEKGDLPKIDAQEAAQEVERRRGGVTKAERDVQKAAYKLSLYLWRENGTPLPLLPAAHAPKTFPSPVTLTEKEAAVGRVTALERRPELKNLALQREQARWEERLARNDRLPNVDIVFNPGLDTGARSVGSTMKAGVLFTLPLQRREAEGRLNNTKLKIQKLDTEEQVMRRRILTEVEDMVSAINTTYERFVAANQEYDLAVILEKGERERFTLGDSTLFLVNQRERATAEAAVKRIDILAEYAFARALYELVTVNLPLLGLPSPTGE